MQDRGTKRPLEGLLEANNEEIKTKKRRTIELEDRLIDRINTNDLKTFVELLPEYCAPRSAKAKTSILKAAVILKLACYSRLFDALMASPSDDAFNAFFKFLLDLKKKEIDGLSYVSSKRYIPTMQDVQHSFLKELLMQYKQIHEKKVAAYVKRFNVEIDTIDKFQVDVRITTLKDVLGHGAADSDDKNALLSFLINKENFEEDEEPGTEFYLKAIYGKIPENPDGQVTKLKMMRAQFPKIDLSELHQIKTLHPDVVLILHGENIPLPFSKYPPQFILKSGLDALYETSTQRLSLAEHQENFLSLFYDCKEIPVRTQQSMTYLWNKLVKMMSIENSIKLLFAIVSRIVHYSNSTMELYVTNNFIPIVAKSAGFFRLLALNLLKPKDDDVYYYKSYLAKLFVLYPLHFKMRSAANA